MNFYKIFPVLIFSFFIFTFNFSLSSSIAQNKVDSLLQIIKTAKEDTAKVSALIKLCDEYRRANELEKAKEFCNQALELSIKIGFLKGRGNAYAYGGLIDYSEKNYSQAIEKLLKALEIAEIGEDKQGRAMCFNSIGNVYNDQGNYNSALSNYLKGLGILEAVGDKQNVAYSYNNIGAVYNRQGNYEKAIENYLKALKIKEELGDKKGIASSYNNIGGIYYKQRVFDKALESYSNALKIWEETKDKRGTAVSYNNIGNIFSEQNNFDKAMGSFSKAINLYKEIGDKAGMAKSYNNMGGVYEKKSKITDGKSIAKINSQYEKALESYFFSLKIKEEIGDKKGIASSCTNIAAIYTKQKKFTEAEAMLNKSLGIAKEIGDKDQIQSNYLALSELFEAQGNGTKGLIYHKLYSDLKDSILNEAISLQITKMQAIYDTDKKQKEIELLNKDNEIKTAENKKQRIAIYSAVGGLALVLILVFFIYRSNRQKHKANLMLERKNIAISQQKEEIEKINLELEKLSIVARETDNSVFIMDSDANIEWANSGFTRLFGYSLEEYIAKNGKNLLNASGNPEIKSIFKTVLDSKKSVVYDAINETKTGNTIWMQTTLTPILNENGSIIKIVAIDSNITEIKNAEKEIKQKNKDITDSINYAKRIQRAILPHRNDIWDTFHQSFVLFKPKDIVSGDFYFFTKNNERSIIAVADCTGHGVPGAFMSMLGTEKLHDAVEKTRNPCEILQLLNRGVKQSLHHSEDKDSTHDGMDIALCVFNNEMNLLEYAGANRNLWIISREKKDEIFEIKATKAAIGGYTPDDKEFEVHRINLNSGDTIYISSDGYADQFSPGHKKLMTKRFKEILVSIQDKSMKEQKEFLNSFVDDWRGNIEQTDDILVIGIRM